MKKSDIIYEAACMVAAWEEKFIYCAIYEITTDYEITEQILRDINEDIELCFGGSMPDALLPHNFYSANPDCWNMPYEEFQTIRAMYCLFLYEDYLSQGD